MAINTKWGIISGGVAFVLAVVISLTLAHTNVPVALLRGLIFLALFFGLGIGIRILIDTFFPELLTPNIGDKDMVNSVFSMESPGSQINITVDDHTNVALPHDLEAPGTEQVGDFSDLTSGGTISLIKDIDQSIENGYTSEEDFTPAFDDVSPKTEDLSTGAGNDFMDFGAFVSESPGNSGGAGEMDSSDTVMDSFSMFPGDDSSGGDFEETSVPERKVSGNKTAKLEGDFNAKEIAQGLRTVLEKDKK